MDERIKGMWVDALLSGEYPKTSKVLKDDEGYCCLGVLCELAVKEGVIETYDGSEGWPEDAVAAWAGYTRLFEVLDERHLTITMVNDHASTFDEPIRFIKDFL